MINLNLHHFLTDEELIEGCGFKVGDIVRYTSTSNRKPYRITDLYISGGNSRDVKAKLKSINPDGSYYGTVVVDYIEHAPISETERVAEDNALYHRLQLELEQTKLREDERENGDMA